MLASICVLAYKRPELLIRSLDSLTATIDFPAEIIVNIDGEDNPDQQAAQVAHSYFRKGLISKLITIGGKNRGVGRSFQNCLGLAEGDIIIKADTDLIYQPRWLSKTAQVLTNNPDIGSLGLFDYHKWDPNDDRFKPENNVIEQRIECDIVKDFVSSIYAFRRKDLNPELQIPDDGLHQSFGKMALLDLVENTAFGVGKSTYVSGTMDNPRKTETYDRPLIFKSE